MASTVTYTGPTDETSIVVAYQIDNDKGDAFTFRKGVPVDDVPADITKRLKDDKDHTFEIGTKTTTGGES
jgi:hypothetical protein